MMSFAFADIPCPNGWKRFKRRCFLLVTTDYKWSQARTNCQNRGGDLAVIDTAEKQEFIKTFLKDNGKNAVELLEEQIDTGVSYKFVIYFYFILFLFCFIFLFFYYFYIYFCKL